MTRAGLSVASCACAIATALLAQGAPVRVRIVSPAEGTYLSGAVMLRALIEPPSATDQVVRLTFFADGRQICAAEQPPFACAWDAGDRVREHVIRAVALLQDGQRLVQNVRTKGLDYAETVEVDIVQVTAVVTTGGRFVRGLTKKDFRVFEDDVQQDITFFGSAEKVPLELVAAIDVSGSMRQALLSVKAAARTFLRALAPEDQVSLIAFNDNLFTLVRRSTDSTAGCAPSIGSAHGAARPCTMSSSSRSTWSVASRVDAPSWSSPTGTTNPAHHRPPADKGKDVLE